jgi:hypothetical protein
MTGFASSNEAIEQKQMTIEEMKINADMKRLDYKSLGWNLRNAIPRLPCFYCCYKYVEIVATENKSDCQKPLAAYFHGY